MRIKVLLSVFVLFSLLASCNMPAGQITITQPTENQPAAVDPNALATAVELTAVARVTQIAGSIVQATPTSTAIPTATSTPTTAAAAAGPCTPLVTANVVANVRSGPDTVYDIVGSLSQGQTATIVGRNDAYTWWYIDYAGIAGNHAWISGSVVTASCVPAVVQAVAAPPTPTIVVADDSSPTLNPNVVQIDPGFSLAVLAPDLVAAGMQVSPNPATAGKATSVQVKVKNTGGAAGSFMVQWWATSSVMGCSWPVSSLAGGASKTLTCSYTYDSASGNNANSIEMVVDSGNTVAESNEGNNNKGGSLSVKINISNLLIIPTKSFKPILPQP